MLICACDGGGRLDYIERITHNARVKNTGPVVNEQQNNSNTEQTQEAADSAADVKVITIVFFTLVLMMVHFASGFTFDL
jgi:hypothetical protein